MFTCRDLMVNVFPGRREEPAVYQMTCQASPAPGGTGKGRPKPPKPPKPNCSGASSKPPRGASGLDELRLHLRQSLAGPI